MVIKGKIWTLNLRARDDGNCGLGRFRGFPPRSRNAAKKSASKFALQADFFDRGLLRYPRKFQDFICRSKFHTGKPRLIAFAPFRYKENPRLIKSQDSGGSWQLSDGGIHRGYVLIEPSGVELGRGDDQAGCRSFDPEALLLFADLDGKGTVLLPMWPPSLHLQWQRLPTAPQPLRPRWRFVRSSRLVGLRRLRPGSTYPKPCRLSCVGL